MDLLVHDMNKNQVFDPLVDVVLVGPVVKKNNGSFWGGTIFSIDFLSMTSEEEFPKADDIYVLNFKRPFLSTDSLMFTTKSAEIVVTSDLNDTMEKVKVVPNPYVMTNEMEPAIGNKFLNQRRRLMFTHIPANCDIRIFTSSGVLVDRIDVQNEPDNGIIHWDLLSKEDLEIAAGMYVYHIKSKETGKEKVGKFAVIK